MPDKPIVNEIQVGNNDIAQNLAEMIKTKIEAIDALKYRRKEARQMYNDGFNNDATFQENNRRAKDAAKEAMVTKNSIASTPSMVTLSHRIKDLNKEIKEDQVALSDYLLEYERLTKATQLELFPGATITIVKSAKAVKVKARKPRRSRR